MISTQSLQEKFAPQSICFGCGPANQKGLRIRSFDSGTPTVAGGHEIVAEWTPEKFHEAFPGMLNGGIIGSLLDCHCNWTAAYSLKNKNGAEEVPCTVTAEYSIKLLRPTPSKGPVKLKARVVEFVKSDRAWVEGELICNINGEDKVCATCRGLFVSVKEGHPAFHRW
jgi:acyl-coenzyme A thioesterase PaaI-like protein